MSTLFVAANAQAGPPQTQPAKSQWLATPDGCLIWDPEPAPDEKGTWSGDCIDGKASGSGTEVFRYRDGGVWKEQRYVGEMQGGKLQGRGTLSEADGSYYKGEFIAGRKNGHGVQVDAKGGTFEGEFKNDRFYGQGTYTFANGARYVGSFRDGLPNGYGTFTRLGETVAGNWVDGCFRDGDRIAAVGVPKERCVVGPTAPLADKLIVPGQRIGPLRLDGKMADITRLVGKGKDRGASPWPGQGAVLHTWDGHGLWVVSDKESGNILWISITADEGPQWAKYTTSEGIRLGITEAQVRSILGEPERIVDEGNMRSIYYDRRGIRLILGKEGEFAGKAGGIRIVWPSVAHGDMLIVPGERISSIALGEPVDKALVALGGGYLQNITAQRNREYYWPHLGLSFVVHDERIVSARLGTNFPSDAANLKYRTADGIGRGSTAAEITGAFGNPEETRPERRFTKATHWWIYTSRGIAFALDDGQCVRLIDVFRPRLLR